MTDGEGKPMISQQDEGMEHQKTTQGKRNTFVDARAGIEASSPDSQLDVTRENVLRPDVLGVYPSDPRRLILDQLGVWVLEGCASVDDDSLAQRIEGYLVSARQMRMKDVTLRIDQQGEDWIQWETAPLPDDLPPGTEIVFVFGMAMGVGSPLPQSSGNFALYVNDRRVATFRCVKHTECWHSGDVSFCFQVKKTVTAPRAQELTLDSCTYHESAASYGLGLVRVSSENLASGRPVSLRVETVNDLPTTRWFRLDVGSVMGKSVEGYGTLKEINYWEGLLRIKGQHQHPQLGTYQVFFGDLHTHSSLSHDPDWPGDGGGTPEENYRYARDVSNLDFYALSEHEHQMPHGKGWNLRQELAERFNQDGRFVTLLSYEWGLAYGQRCVYYEHGGQPLYSSYEGATTPSDLWACLAQISGRAITIPHHPAWCKSPLDLNYHNPRFDRLFEVYSCWGDFEYDGAVQPGSFDRFEGRCLRDVLHLGYRMGVIASSDGHDGHPGDGQGLPRQPQLYHYLGSGRAAVLAKELSRQAVFDALYQRRTYGTTGEPIVLDFRVNDVVMGGEIGTESLTEPPEIWVEAIGTGPLARIILIRNGQTACVQVCDAPHGYLTWRDQEYDEAAYYYARVEQEDGEMAWSSPIWVGCPDRD
jgi:hypothetical protein